MCNNEGITLRIRGYYPIDPGADALRFAGWNLILMSRFQFELALREHDAELRGILAATPTDGAIRLSFRREPSFFDAAVVDGHVRQAIACRDRTSNRIAGFGSRSIAVRYVNGQAMPIGYLSNLRGLPEYRNRGLLARGYAYLSQLHRDGQTKLYLTTIAEGNESAIALLTSGRAGLPSYHFAGVFHTIAIPLNRRSLGSVGHCSGTDPFPLPSPAVGVRGNGRTVPHMLGQRRRHEEGVPVRVRPASLADVDAVVAFLNRIGPYRQFFPRYEAKDFFNTNGTFRDLLPSNLLLAFRGGELVGTLAGWNQRQFRQTVVHGYGGALRWARPIVNTWARMRGRSPLPRPGAPLRPLLAALPVVLDDERAVFELLLWTLISGASAADHDFVLVGLHAGDPLLPVARAFGRHSYQTRLYLVCWDDGDPLRRAIDTRPPYLELGCL